MSIILTAQTAESKQYTITLTEQQVEMLKSILAQIEPMNLICSPNSKPKKLTKSELIRQSITEDRIRKAERARKKNL